MYELNSILENKTINGLISGFKRSPNQLNNPHESDAEIIKMNDTLFAVTTDSISEEISAGLYRQSGSRLQGGGPRPPGHRAACRWRQRKSS